jgi:hypothetical protein
MQKKLPLLQHLIITTPEETEKSTNNQQPDLQVQSKPTLVQQDTTPL